MRLDASLNSVNTNRKPLPARHSQRYFGGGGYDADRLDSGQVAVRMDEIHRLIPFRNLEWSFLF
jgi:hypothetical protein